MNNESHCLCFICRHDFRGCYVFS